jgi:hypothetical protein
MKRLFWPLVVVGALIIGAITFLVGVVWTQVNAFIVGFVLAIAWADIAAHYWHRWGLCNDDPRTAVWHRRKVSPFVPHQHFTVKEWMEMNGPIDTQEKFNQVEKELGKLPGPTGSIVARHTGIIIPKGVTNTPAPAYFYDQEMENEDGPSS